MIKELDSSQGAPKETPIDLSRYREPKALFNALISSGLEWGQIVDQFVRHPSVEKKTGADPKIAMEQLIAYRDGLDFDLYTETVRDLFASNYFEIKVVEDGTLKYGKEGHPEFDKKWYRIEIYNVLNDSSGRSHDPNSSCCQITIKAPGSRNLTSDIDTSISVEGIKHLKLAHLPGSLTRNGIDYNGALKIEVIKGFNEKSQARHKMTSSLNRDSNAYIDGFMADYAKFNDNLDEHQIAVNGKAVISNTKEFYAEHKKIKHQYELAASLISLRFALGDSGWKQFKDVIVEEAFGRKKARIESAKRDFAKACEFAEQWSDTASEKIRILKQEKEASDYGRNSPLKDKNLTAWNRDMQVSALNDLYAEHLEKVVKLNGDIIVLNQELPTLIQSAESSLKNIDATKEHLKALKSITSPGQKTKSSIEQANKDLASVHETHKHNLKVIEEKLKERATLENEKQRAQIQAHIFANEAYINRSAPHHVVEGMQGGKKVAISKQTLMCSALPQIGFKLLHTNIQRSEGSLEENIAYKNAKYGWRVADLIFPQSKEVYAPKDIVEMLKKPVLQYLKLTGYPATAIIANIKRSDKIKEPQKGQETLKQLIERVTLCSEEKGLQPEKITKKRVDHFIKHEEPKLWLSIGAKLIAASYVAKFKAKKGLWGDIGSFAPKKAIQTSIPKESPSAVVSTLKTEPLNAQSIISESIVKGDRYKFYSNSDPAMIKRTSDEYIKIVTKKRTVILKPNNTSESAKEPGIRSKL